MDIDLIFDGSAPAEERALAGAFLIFDIVPGGKVLKRVFPTRSARKLADWTRQLFNEHVAHAPATRRAMAAALRFSQEIVEDTIKIKGAGGKGTDIVATTADGLRIGREVTVIKRNSSSLYGKLIDEANQAAKTVDGMEIDLPEVFLQVTDEYLSQPGAREVILEKAVVAINDFHNMDSRGRNLVITVVDGLGNQLFPLALM